MNMVATIANGHKVAGNVAYEDHVGGSYETSRTTNAENALVVWVIAYTIR